MADRPEHWTTEGLNDAAVLGDLVIIVGASALRFAIVHMKPHGTGVDLLMVTQQQGRAMSPLGACTYSVRTKDGPEAWRGTVDGSLGPLIDQQAEGAALVVRGLVDLRQGRRRLTLERVE